MIGDRIFQARVGAGLSLRELSEKAHGCVSAQMIHKYETGDAQPGSDILVALSKALGVRVEFFFRPESFSVHLSPPAYRKSAKTSVKQMEAIRVKAAERVEKYLELESVFPENRFQRIGHGLSSGFSVETIEQVENVADDLRKKWALGNGPIDGLCELLEDRGVKVVMVDTEAEIDGLSCWANEAIPVALVKRDQTGDRLRFSLAHELGHLLLRIPESINPEKAANRFAGAFLAPQSTVRAELGSHRSAFSPFELSTLRVKYGLSVQAWIYRAHDLAIISDSLFRQMFGALKKQGLFTREIGKPLPAESPRRFERLVVQAVEEELISSPKGADLLGISLVDLRKKVQSGT